MSSPTGYFYDFFAFYVLQGIKLISLYFAVLFKVRILQKCYPLTKRRRDKSAGETVDLEQSTLRSGIH